MPQRRIRAANRSGPASVNATGWSGSTRSVDQSTNAAPGTWLRRYRARPEPSSRHRRSTGTIRGSPSRAASHSVETSTPEAYAPPDGRPGTGSGPRFRRLQREEQRQLSFDLGREIAGAVVSELEERERPVPVGDVGQLVQELDPQAGGDQGRHDLAEPVAPPVLRL